MKKGEARFGRHGCQTSRGEPLEKHCEKVVCALAKLITFIVVYY